MKVRKIIRYIATVLIAVGVFLLLQRLLMPKYVDDIIEGSLIQEYYDEEKNHDVVFIGDCEVYENFSPAVLWEEYGINSYIRGSAQQLIWQSYYLLEDTLKYETPKAIVFNVLSMKYNVPQKEAYNRMSIEGMRWSKSKIDNIYASMMEDENFEDYLFPIFRYHSRWSELKSTDLTYFFDVPKVSFNGYYMRVDVKPAVDLPKPKPLADYAFGDNSYYYLDKMTALCKEKGIELILIKAPSLYPAWYDEWETQIEDYAEKNNLKYYNFLELIDEVGLDFEQDTYDAGLHLNLSGAEKLSKYFGNILKDTEGVTDKRNDIELSKIWEEKLKAYNKEIDRQYDYYNISK